MAHRPIQITVSSMRGTRLIIGYPTRVPNTTTKYFNCFAWNWVGKYFVLGPSVKPFCEKYWVRVCIGDYWSVFSCEHVIPFSLRPTKCYAVAVSSQIKYGRILRRALKAVLMSTIEIPQQQNRQVYLLKGVLKTRFAKYPPQKVLLISEQRLVHWEKSRLPYNP